MVLETLGIGSLVKESTDAAKVAKKKHVKALLAESLGVERTPEGEGLPPGHAERVNEQCWLMDNYVQFAFPNQTYEHLTCMLGNPVDVMQALAAKPGQESFLGMRPDKYAQLVPLCRIYKYEIDPTSGENPKPKKGVPPREIKFSTVFDEQSVRSDATIGAAIFGAGLGANRGDQVGLKEVIYELQPGGKGNTKGAQQNVTIKFVGDSMEALHRQGVLDLVLRSNKYLPTKGSDGKYTVTGANRNPNWYMIKLVYGWQLPPGHTLAGGLNPNERKAIERSRTTLTLFMDSHELNFNKDGSVEIAAKFRGTVDVAATQVGANILEADAATKQIKDEHSKTQQKLQDTKKSQEAQAKKVAKKLHAAQDEEVALLDKRAKGDKTQRTKAELIKAEAAAKTRSQQYEGALAGVGKIDQQVEDLKNKLEEDLLGDRQAKYAAVVNDLIARNKLWFAEIPVEELSQENNFSDRMARSVGDGRPAPPIKVGQDTSSKESAEKGVGAIKQHLQKKVSDKAAEKATRHQQSRDTSRMNSSDTAKGNFNKNNFSKATTFEDGTKYRINFIYWGDILTSVLDIAYKGKLPMRFLVGSLTYKDAMTGSLKSINLADIPISLELFTSWWMQNVVSPQKAFYTVRQFIEDSVQQLIVAALGHSCNAYAHNFGQVGRQNSTASDSMKISYTTFSAPLGQGQKDRLANKGRISLNSGDIFSYKASNQAGATSYLKPEDQVEYTYIYCDAWGAHNKAGNRREDHREGIYHIHIGNEVGPITGVNFKRDDKLANADADDRANNQGIDQLGSYYHAEVQMLGNTLFMPGNLVYITPSALGMSAQLAAQLGLGGYYVITKLSGKLGGSGWRANIECRMQGQSANEKGGSHDSSKATSPKEAVTQSDAADPSTKEGRTADDWPADWS